MIAEERGLLEALGEAGAGILCIAGAGGKKTLLRRLAEAHPGRVALTTTVHMKHFEAGADLPWIAPNDPDDLPSAVMEAAGRARCLAYGGPEEKEGRVSGVDPAAIAALHGRAGFDLTAVKADGARMRWLKGHRDDEPTLVPGTKAVILLASLRALGRPLDERSAHRPEIVSALSSCAAGETFGPPHLAALLAAQAERLEALADAPVIPLLNMADDLAAQEAAKETAAALLERRRLSKVLVACLADGPPAVTVLGP